jgi:hypothetical protein
MFGNSPHFHRWISQNPVGKFLNFGQSRFDSQKSSGGSPKIKRETPFKGGLG